MNTLNKECRVVMLFTRESNIWSYKERRLYYNQANPNDIDESKYYKLYIISDDEIKLNDWYLNLDLRSTEWGVIQATTERLAEISNDAPSCKKIIASTDISLGLVKDQNDCPMPAYSKLLPQIPQDFIEKYIDSYNAGSPIEKVLIEYDCLASDKFVEFDLSEHSSKDLTDSYCIENRIKVNPNNTISIISSPVKNTFTREEVENLLDWCGENTYHNSTHLKPCWENRRTGTSQDILDKWIKENLK